MKPSTPTKTVNGLEAELAVASEILDQHHLDTKVTCPESVYERPGYTFTCIARFKIGGDPVKVTVTDSKGDITYAGEVPLALLDVGAVERSITQTLAQQGARATTVKCHPRSCRSPASRSRARRRWERARVRSG